jgi:hypothetical protein
MASLDFLFYDILDYQVRDKAEKLIICYYPIL